MQEIMIKSEFDHSYLLIQIEPVWMDEYPFFMITQNRIEGLLNCKLRYIEDVSYCSYEISSKHSLTQEYQDSKMSFEDIRELFYGIQRILRNASEFLLDKEEILLEPEYIYKDLETEELFCLYFPGKIEEKEKGKYRNLADFLLDKADYKDEHAINCVYQFYKMSKETYFSFEAFISFLEKEEFMFQAEKKRQEEIRKPEKEKMLSIENNEAEDKPIETLFDSEETKTVNWWIPGIIAGTGILLLALYFFVPYLRYFALYLLLPGLCLIIVAIILCVRNGYHLYQKNKEKEWSEPLEPVSVEEYFDDMLDNETVYFEEEFCYCLKWKEGHFSREYHLTEFPLSVGKLKESVEVYIEDPSISRLHACLKRQGKEIVLQDLDSTNGTYINGKRLASGEAGVIKRNDEIQFGKIIVNVV